MSEHVNGAEAPGLPVNQNILQTQIQEMFKQHFSVVFNGIVLHNLQGVPPAMVICAASVAMGRLISEYTHIPNDLQGMLTLRKKANELFTEASRSVGGLIMKPGN